MQLRLNKVSELIHNSAQHRNIQSATVSVFFEEIVEMVCPWPVLNAFSRYHSLSPSRQLQLVTLLIEAHAHGYVQADDDFEVLPGSELTISRTANKNNKSDYFVDGKKSNFKEVTDLLKEKGVDLNNNRFLILQVCSKRDTALSFATCRRMVHESTLARC